MKSLLAVSLVLAASACGPHRRSVVTGVGGTLAVASIATGVSALVQSIDCHGDCHDSGAEEGRDAAQFFLTVGVALAVATYYIANADAPADEPAPPTVIPEPAPPRAGSTASAVPPGATDDETARLARQATRAAALGQCSAARVTLRAIERRDAAYHDELTATPAFAGCR